MDPEYGSDTNEQDEMPWGLIGGLFVLFIIGLGLWAYWEFMPLRTRKVDSTTNVQTLPAITAFAQLKAENSPEELIGRDIAIQGVRVSRVAGDYLFYAHTEDAQGLEIPIVIVNEMINQQPEERIQIREGQKVTLIGRIHSLKDINAVKGSALLRKEELDRLAKFDFWIAADTVVVHRATP